VKMGSGFGGYPSSKVVKLAEPLHLEWRDHQSLAPIILFHLEQGIFESGIYLYL
jgi:hypothetical protein